MNSGLSENSPLVKLSGTLLLFCGIGLLYSAYKALEPKSEEIVIASQAYVSLVTSDDDVLPVTVLGQSLRDSLTLRKFVILVTEDVSQENQIGLQHMGFVVKPIKTYNPDPTQYSNNEAKNKFTKLRIWEVTEFEKIVFLEKDCMVLQNVDALFDYITSFAASLDCCDRFNSGVFVTYPSSSTFSSMAKALRDSKYNHETVTHFLNSYFPSWHRLPFPFNAQLNYLAESKHMWKLEDLKIVQFVDNMKPWKDLEQNNKKDMMMEHDNPLLKQLTIKWNTFYQRLNFLYETAQNDMMAKDPL